MSNLLFNEPPLVISPTLAKELGLGEAIVLQQLHYWLLKSNHLEDGRKWIYNTYGAWQIQFPFWSEKTIKRIISNLKTKNIVLVGNYNKSKIDRTNWYSINYNKIVSHPSGQIDPSIVSNCPDQEDKMTSPIPENTTEITQEKNIYSVFSHWNSKGNIFHRKLSDKLKGQINSKLQDYTPEEIKTAIDNYHTVLNGDEYFWSHRWTLGEFLSRENGIVKFMPENKPLSNFLKNKPNNTPSPGNQTLEEKLRMIREW